MKFLQELGEAQSNLSYAYAHLKGNSRQENLHNEMKKFMTKFASFFNHVEAYTNNHGKDWLFNTMQSTDIMSEQEKEVQDILVIDDDFDFDLYKSYLSDSIKQNSVIKGNMQQTFLLLGEDPHLKVSEEQSQAIATNAINQASQATLQAEQSLQLYTRIANQNNAILNEELRKDIPDQLNEIRRKSISIFNIVNQDNDVEQEQSSFFSVDESVISQDTQQELQQQKQQYKNILDRINIWTQQSSSQLFIQNEQLFNQSSDHQNDTSLHMLPSTDLSGKNNVIRRMQQTNNSLKRRYMQDQVLGIIKNLNADNAMNNAGSIQSMYSTASSTIPDGTIDSDNLLDYLVQDINQGQYSNKIMQDMQQSMGKNMADEIIKSSRDDAEDQTMGDFVLKRFERFIPDHQYLKKQQLYKVLKDPENNEDKVFHFCRDYIASNRLEKQVVTQLLHNAGYSNSFDTDNLNYLGTDVFFQNSSKLQGQQKKQLQTFNTNVMNGSMQQKAIDLQSDPDKITEDVLRMNKAQNIKSNVDQLRTTIKKHVVDFMHDSKNGGDILFNYELVSLNSPDQIINGKINQMKFDLDYSTKDTTDYERSLDLKEAQNAIYLERMLNTMRISKMVSKDYKSYFTSDFANDASLSDVEKAYRSQQIENVMSAFKVPYKLQDDDSLIEQKYNPVTERKSLTGISRMTKEFLSEIIMLKTADEELTKDIEGLEDYGGSSTDRLFMDKLLHSVARNEKPHWLMTCTYMEPIDKSEVGLNIPMGKYEQQFVQDLMRSPFWRDLPKDNRDKILQSRLNKEYSRLRRLNLHAFDDEDLAAKFKNYRISKDVQDMSETFNVQVQNFMHQLAKVPSVDVIDYPLIQKINDITTGFSQAYNYYVGGQNEQDAQSSVDKVKSMYTYIKEKFNLEDLSEGRVQQNSKVYESLLEAIHSKYFRSSSAPFNQRQLQQYVQGDENIGEMMRSQMVNKGLKNLLNISMVGAGLMAMTMGTAPYVMQTGVPHAQNFKIQGIQYANKASSLIYDQMNNQVYTGGGFEIDYVTSSLDTLSKVKESASKDDPLMTLDNLKAYQLGDDSVGLYQYMTHQQVGQGVSASIKELYKGGYSLYQTAKEVIDPLGTAKEQTQQREYYEKLSDIATLSSKNLKDDYLQRRTQGTLGEYKDDRAVQQRVQDLEQAVRQMTYYDVSAAAIKEELGQDAKIKQNTGNMIKDLEEVVLFQIDQTEPSLLFNALNLDKENVYAQSHLLPSIFKSTNFQRKLPFLDHAIYASNVQTQETMGQLKGDDYKPGDDNYYNAQLAKTIWANYSVNKEVRKTKHFKINLVEGDNIDKGDYIDVFNLRKYVPLDDMETFDRIESATLKAYDSGEQQFKSAVDQYTKLKQKDQAFEQLYDGLIQQNQDQQTNQLMKRSGVLTSGQFFDIKSPLLYNTVFDPNYLIPSGGGGDDNKSVFDSDIYQTVALKLASQVQIIQQSKDSQLRDSLVAMQMNKDAQINGVYVKNIMDWDNFQNEEVKDIEVTNFNSRAVATANTNRQVGSQYYLQQFQEFSNQYASQNPQIQSILNELDSITSNQSMTSFAVLASSIMYSLFSRVKKRMYDTEGQQIGAKQLTNEIKEMLGDGVNLKQSLVKQTQFAAAKRMQQHQELLINQQTNVNPLKQINTAVTKVKSNLKTGLDAASQLVIKPALQPVKQIKILNNIQSATRILSDANVDQYQKALPLISTNPDKEELHAIENSLQMQEKSQQLLESAQGKDDIKQVSSLVDKSEFSIMFEKMQGQTQQAFKNLSEKIKKSEEATTAATAAAAPPKLQNDARTIGSLLGGRKSEESIQSMHDRINFMEGNLKRTLGNINTNVSEYLKPSPYQLIGEALNRRDRNPIADQLMSAGMPSFLGNSQGKSGKSKKISVMSALNSKRAKKLKKKQKKKRK